MGRTSKYYPSTAFLPSVALGALLTRNYVSVLINEFYFAERCSCNLLIKNRVSCDKGSIASPNKISINLDTDKRHPEERSDVGICHREVTEINGRLPRLRLAMTIKTSSLSFSIFQKHRDFENLKEIDFRSTLLRWALRVSTHRQTLPLPQSESMLLLGL